MSRDTRRAVITERIRFVKQLEGELKKINKAQAQLGYMELEKPSRDGWFKTYILRDDIRRSKKARIYQEVLDAVLVEIWGREKKYADKKWQRYFRIWNKRHQRPGIKRLYEKEFSKLSTNAQKCSIRRRRPGYKERNTIYVCLLPKYYFQISYRRAYLTKIKIISPQLEQREQEILEILSRPTLRTYSMYYNYRYRLYREPHRGERRKMNMTLSTVGVGAFDEGERRGGVDIDAAHASPNHSNG